MAERLDRLVPPRFFGYFLQALEDQMGVYCLRMALAKAGLDTYIPQSSYTEFEFRVSSAQFATMQQAIRLYYGSGARGYLIRVGRQVWQNMFAEGGRRQALRFLILRTHLADMRARNVLDTLAAWMRQGEGGYAVHFFLKDIIYVDRISDTTYGQTSSEPICWLMSGMIQAALSRVSGREYDVEEFACMSMGAEACKFRIHY